MAVGVGRKPAPRPVRNGSSLQRTPHFGFIPSIIFAIFSMSNETRPRSSFAPVLATNVIPEAMQLVLVDGVDPAEAVAEAQARIVAIRDRLEG